VGWPVSPGRAGIYYVCLGHIQIGSLGRGGKDENE
jgi:hypothetical protein